MWARLLAAAADPAPAKSFRLAFVDTVKKIDPLDAAVMQVARPVAMIDQHAWANLAKELDDSHRVGI
jgi:hypothetical protein